MMLTARPPRAVLTDVQAPEGALPSPAGRFGTHRSSPSWLRHLRVRRVGRGGSRGAGGGRGAGYPGVPVRVLSGRGLVPFMVGLLGLLDQGVRAPDQAVGWMSESGIAWVSSTLSGSCTSPTWAYGILAYSARSPSSPSSPPAASAPPKNTVPARGPCGFALSHGARMREGRTGSHEKVRQR